MREELTSALTSSSRRKRVRLLAIAVSNEQLDLLCEPLRGRHKLPDQVTISPSSSSQNSLAKKFSPHLREADATILAIAQKGKLVAATLPHHQSRRIPHRAPPHAPRRRTRGAPVNFSKVAVERELAGWMTPSRSNSRRPRLLVPSTLRSSRDRSTSSRRLDPGAAKAGRRAKIRDWLAVAGLIYLFFLLAPLPTSSGFSTASASSTPGGRRHPLRRFHRQPESRWTALQPATDPTVTPSSCCTRSTPPSPRRTSTSPSSTRLRAIQVEGEAPNDNMFVQYLQSLKDNSPSASSTSTPVNRKSFPTNMPTSASSEAMKLSPRERFLAIIVGGAVVFLLNVGLLSAFARRNIVLRTQLADRRSSSPK